MPSAIVVGCGVVGGSTGWALRRRGWDVTVVEQGPVPNPHASSGGIHRLIRTTYGPMEGYTAMVAAAYPVWDLLWSDLGEELMEHTGMLAVDTAAGTFGADTAATLERLGLPFETLDRDEVRRRVPVLRIPDDATAVLVQQAHFLRARAIVGAIGRWLTAHGATVRDHARVTGVDTAAGTVALDDGTVLSADRVVVAAGPWTDRLVDDVGTGLTPSRQVVIDLEVPGHLAEAWSTAPAFLVQPAYGIPPRSELPLKVGDHAFSMRGDPDEDREPRPDEVEAVMEVARVALAEPDAYRMLEARACYYTHHAEERFVVEPRDDRGAVAAGFTGHGFKFGPLVGQGIAAALDGDAPWSDVTTWAAGRTTDTPFIPV